MRVKCLAQDQNTMSPTSARTRTGRSGDEPTSHEITAPPEEEAKWNITQDIISLNLNRGGLTMLISGQSMPVLEISGPTTRYSCTVLDGFSSAYPRLIKKGIRY